uniref:Uncharacterized protein n=1 Tax=Setaria italica TaxID=4555 RepID=K4AJ97_SETIT
MNARKHLLRTRPPDRGEGKAVRPVAPACAPCGKASSEQGERSHRRAPLWHRAGCSQILLVCLSIVEFTNGPSIWSYMDACTIFAPRMCTSLLELHVIL